MIEYTPYHPHDFDLKYPKVGRYGTPQEELTKISKTLPQQLTFLASGGADSEAMIKWFANAGKDVEAIAYRLMYNGDFVNEHDLAYVSELDGICPVTYRDFDLEFFWEGSWFWTFVEHYKCTSPQLPMHAFFAFLSSCHNHTVLTSVHPEPKHFRDTTFVQEREKDYAVTRFLRGSRCLVNPLRSTPGILASIMDSEEFRNFHTFGIVDGRERKSQQYKDWFDVDIKPRPKYHGFEHHSALDNKMRMRIWDKFKYSEVHMYLPANELVENMKPGVSTYSSNKYLKIMYEDCHMIGPAQ
jgi:hypothetical protein